MCLILDCGKIQHQLLCSFQEIELLNQLDFTVAHKGHAFSVQPIAAPWKLTCSVHFRLFAVQIYRCYVQNRLLHTNIRSFSVQKLSFSVENSILLRTNRMLLRRKFDASPHKSNASPWKIRYFSVQIKSFCMENSMFLSTNRKFPRAKFDASPYKSKAIESFSVENYTVNWAT